MKGFTKKNKESEILKRVPQTPASEFAKIPTEKRKYAVLYIQKWEYSFTINEDGSLNVSHVVTRSDCGYGNEVNETFDASYFESHTAKDLYKYISTLQCSAHLNRFDREAELKKLNAFLDASVFWERSQKRLLRKEQKHSRLVKRYNEKNNKEDRL